jgi:hypothetical protein
VKQGSPEWLQARCGLATASCFADVLATIKSGEAADRRNYRAQLIAERLTGVPAESFQSAEMRWGNEQEPFGRIAYEATTGNVVKQVAFIRHPELMAGASPDGLIGTDGGIELKCPNTATHIDTLLKGMSPSHIPQVQGNMWLAERQWWDFVSYDPRMPERMQLYVQRIKRDDAYIEKLEAEVRKFLAEVDKVIAELEANIQ